jgi:hypothetical protein
MSGPDEQIAKCVNQVQRTTHKRTNTTDRWLCAAIVKLAATPAKKLVALDRTIAHTRHATTEPRYPDDHQTAMNRLRIATISLTNLGRLQPGQKIFSAPLQQIHRARSPSIDGPRKEAA